MQLPLLNNNMFSIDPSLFNFKHNWVWPSSNHYHQSLQPASFLICFKYLIRNLFYILHSTINPMVKHVFGWSGFMGINQTRGPIVEGDQTKPLDRYQADRYRLYVTLGMFLYPLAMEQCTANILWLFETLWRQRQSALNYILETQGVQGNQIWHFLQNYPLELFHQYFPPSIFPNYLGLVFRYFSDQIPRLVILFMFGQSWVNFDVCLKTCAIPMNITLPMQVDGAIMMGSSPEQTSFCVYTVQLYHLTPWTAVLCGNAQKIKIACTGSRCGRLAHQLFTKSTTRWAHHLPVYIPFPKKDIFVQWT